MLEEDAQWRRRRRRRHDRPAGRPATPVGRRLSRSGGKRSTGTKQRHVRPHHPPSPTEPAAGIVPTPTLRLKQLCFLLLKVVRHGLDQTGIWAGKLCDLQLVSYIYELRRA